MDKKETFSKIDIEKDMITYENAIIQMINVSKISLEPMEKMKIPVYLLIPAILIWVFFYNIGRNGTGMGLCFACIVPIIYALSYNDNLGLYLVLSLNSGDKVYFKCKDKEFLEKAFNEIIESIKMEKMMSVNFNNCTINSVGKEVYNGDKIQGDKIAGDKNVDISGDQNIFSDTGKIEITNNDNDWKVAESMFRNLLNDYRVDTEQYEFCELALKYCDLKKRDRLKNLIERRKPIFDSIVAGFASNTISAAFVELIRKLTGVLF